MNPWFAGSRFLQMRKGIVYRSPHSLTRQLQPNPSNGVPKFPDNPRRMVAMTVVMIMIICILVTVAQIELGG
jgi:hypothetical protein